MSKKALYIPCYSGELGWEIINYVPYINRICKNGNFNEVHVVVRKGREALYPMGTHFYPICLSTSKSMGNSGNSPPRNNIVKTLKKNKFEVVKIKPLPSGCRYAKKREFLKYNADKNILHKWNIPHNSVTVCVRDRVFGKHKNWSEDKWKMLCEYLLKNSFVPIITGIRETFKFDFPVGCLDLRNKTSIADFIAIAQQSKFVLGQSTGTIHLASLAGVPHVCWGSSRLRERYLKSWNPYSTPVVYLSLGSQFNCEVDKVVKLIDAIMKKI